MMQVQLNFRYAVTGLFFIAMFSAILLFSTVYGQEVELATAEEAWISGNVIWEGYDLTKASVQVYKDPKLKDLYTSGILLKPEGMYALTIEDPGTYYIVAFVDNNSNGQFDAGDGMGIYGVKDWADRDQQPKPVKVEEGTKLPGIDIQIIATVDAQGGMRPLSPEPGVVTGISGKLIWQNVPSEEEGGKQFANAIIFVYSDPSWNNRIMQANAKGTGEYELSVPAGRYYLLAVIDENNSNLLDVGDKFGIWGMTKFGMFPRAAKVNEGSVIRDRNILIIGRMDITGKPLPLDTGKQDETEGQAGEAASIEDRIVLSGNVIWPKHELKYTMVQAYSDPSMTVATAQAKTDDKGKFKLAVPAGDYYVVAGVDADGDGKYTKGDGIGSYGVANAAEQMPKKLTVTEDLKNKEISLVITAEFDGSGQLKPILYKLGQAPLSEFTDVVPAGVSAASSAGISGRITWEGLEISKATMIFSKEPRFTSGIKTPLQLDDDGLYSCSAPPGDYHIMAIVDLNDNGLVDAGDGRGRYGEGYWGTPQKVTVLEGRVAPFININVTEALNQDGQIIPIKSPGSIRFRYGEPGSIYKGDSIDRNTQEWWYWSKGLAFTFEETDAGWNLIDTYEFTPTDPETEQSGTEENPDGMLYYTFDKSIWAVDADGTNRRWIAQGTRPTATLDGSNLLFIDTSGDIYRVGMGNDLSDELVLSRREAGLEAAMSHNGKAVAFTQDSGRGYRQMILKNLDTGEGSALPVGVKDLYDPAWSHDDELVAYSATPPSDNPLERNRDIFYYDLLNGRTERVSTSPMDEFAPAWPPLDRRSLVYCRAEGEHAQLWIVKFDADGKPTERQITKYGGQNPAWSPKGDKIIYENNAQLWTINPDGSEESPLVIDDEPIFGLDPFWVQ